MGANLYMYRITALGYASHLAADAHDNAFLPADLLASNISSDGLVKLMYGLLTEMRPLQELSSITLNWL